MLATVYRLYSPISYIYIYTYNFYDHLVTIQVPVPEENLNFIRNISFLHIESDVARIWHR